MWYSRLWLFMLLFVPVLASPAVLSAQDRSVPSSNAQKVFAWGSPEHEALQWLAIEAGQAMPSGTGPFSAAELRMELSRIDAGRLSDAGRRRRAWLRDRISTERAREQADVAGENLLFSAGLEFNLETYLDLSDEVDAWEYRPSRRLPFLAVPLEAWAGEHAYGIIDLDFRKFPPAPGGYNTSEPDPWTNALVTDINSLDIEFPSRAFLSVGGDFWNLQFGRDDVNWGNGYTGNVYLSDSVREYDFARLTGFWRFFKFSTIWVSMEGGLSPTESQALSDGRQFVDVSVDADGNIVDDDDPDAVATRQLLTNTSKYADIRDLHRSFLAHRFEVRLWDRLNLIATEGIIYGGDDMELRYLNPLMLYHNQYTNPLPGNNLMSYEIEYTPAPGWLTYVQLAVDQWSSPLETGSYTANEPNALGYLAGVRWQQPAGRGFVRTVAEAALMDPWVYIHNRGHTSLSYRDLLAAESFTTGDNPSSRVWIEEPLGYYTGNDSAVMFLESRYVEPGSWFAGLRARAEVRGELDMTATLPAGDEEDLSRKENQATTPSGAHAEWTTFLTLFGELETPRSIGQVTLGGELTWATLTNAGNLDTPTEHDLQLVLYTRLIRR